MKIIKNSLLIVDLLSIAISTLAQVKHKIPDLVKNGDIAYLKGELIFPLDDKPTPEYYAQLLKKQKMA